MVDAIYHNHNSQVGVRFGGLNGRLADLER